MLIFASILFLAYATILKRRSEFSAILIAFLNEILKNEGTTQ